MLCCAHLHRLRAEPAQALARAGILHTSLPTTPLFHGQAKFTTPLLQGQAKFGRCILGHPAKSQHFACVFRISSSSTFRLRVSPDFNVSSRTCFAVRNPVKSRTRSGTHPIRVQGCGRGGGGGVQSARGGGEIKGACRKRLYPPPPATHSPGSGFTTSLWLACRPRVTRAKLNISI